MNEYNLDKINLEIPVSFGGSEKKAVAIFNNKKYLFKFPDPIREKNNDLSYMNNQFSEYVGCKIYNLLGLDAQETILGKKYFEDKGKEKILVGCEVFTDDKNAIFEFSELLNYVNFDESSNNRDNSFENFYKILELPNIDKEAFLEQFNNMLVVDCLIANGDRHFHNIGYKLNEVTNNYEPTKIFDCGSCLCALYSDKVLNDLNNDQTLLKEKIYNLTTPYYYKNKRLLFHELFENPDENLKSAINRIYPRINIDLINKTIDETPYISEIRRTFYKKAIQFNYENIIKNAYLRINDLKSSN